MQHLDIIHVEPEFQSDTAGNGDPVRGRLAIKLSLEWVNDVGEKHWMLLGQASFPIPSFVTDPVELAWPYVEGSTFCLKGMRREVPPPTDSSSSSSEA